MELVKRTCAHSGCKMTWRTLPNDKQIHCSRDCELESQGITGMRKVTTLNRMRGSRPRKTMVEGYKNEQKQTAST